MHTCNPVAQDLISCARNSINYLRNAVDPGLGYEPYFTGKIFPVPYMEHSEWDFGDVTARFIEAWFAVRDITGYKGSKKIEDAQKNLLLSLTKKDGLCYRPGTPWSQPLAHVWDQGRTMLALADAGYGQYWDEIEPFVRNQLMEAQFRITPRYLELVTESTRPDTASRVYKNAGQRLSGSFIDRTRPHDWFFERYNNPDGTRGGFSSGGCCGAAGPRALHFVWKKTVTE